MSRLTRRDVLRTAAGATALTFAGPVSGAGGADQYVVTATGGRVDRALDDAGFDVRRSLAGGDVLVVEGSGDPAAVRGVGEAVRNVRFRRERPPVDVDEGEAEAADAPTDGESLYEDYQWDKQTTEAAAAHETTTGEGTSVAIIDSGVDLDHPDLAPNVVPGGLFRLVSEDNEVSVAGEPGVYVAGEDPAGVPVRIPAAPVSTLDQVTNADGDPVGYHPGDFEVVTDRRVDDDVDGHGTHVAGIAAATVGSEVLFEGFTGVAGMAPDATVVPHRVFYWVEEEVTYTTEDDEEVTETLVNQFASFADILAAIDYAANTAGVDAMNMSIGTPPLPPQVNSTGIRTATNLVVRDAVNAGSVVVVSAGNSDTELNKGGVFTLPNSVPGTMSIAATGPNDERVFYSNYGTNEVSVGAPGGGYDTLAKTLAAPYRWELIYGQDDDDEPTVDLDGDGTPDADVGFEYPTTTEDGEVVLENVAPVEWPYPFNLVLSTVPPDVYGGDIVAGAYAWFAGTSMAAPQVAGAAALVAAANPDLDPARIERAVARGAETATGRDRNDVGAGVLNAAGAVEAADDAR